MKLNNTKFITTLFSLTALLVFSACGSSGNSSSTQLVEGTVQGQAPYDIDAHQGTTAVVHAQGDHTGTHNWTQVSGTSVALTATNTPTTTFTVPTNTTTAIVLQHTHTHPQTGVATVTHHTVTPIQPVPQPTPTPTQALTVLVGKPQVVFSGDIASLHASAFGGTAPYTYDWIAPGGIFLDTTHPTAPTFAVPSLPIGNVSTISVGLQVMDANGDTVTSNESITITQKQLIINPKTATQTVNSNHIKSQSGPHPVSSLKFSIQNPINTESYTWTVKPVNNNNLALVDLKMVLANVHTTKARIAFRSPDVTTSSTYTLIVRAQNSKGDRVGVASHEYIINP